MHVETILFNNVAMLCKRLKKHIAVYDLETTTFRGRPNFGITEVCSIFISPEGELGIEGDLVNPERPIDPRVVQLTGISDAMVRNKPNWGNSYAQMFENIASGECWATGFNNRTFDNHAVIEMNRRYGRPIQSFSLTFDVRELHLILTKAKSKAGKLVEIAQQYGVTSRSELHRARADAVLTVELLDAIIGEFGIDAVAACIEAGQDPVASLISNRPSAEDLNRASTAPTKLSQTALLSFLQGKEAVEVPHMREALGVDEKTLSFELGKAIDEGKVNPRIFAKPLSQSWITQELIELDYQLLEQGKLKPIYDALASSAPEDILDYVQLRIALLTAGLRWATLQTK